MTRFRIARPTASRRIALAPTHGRSWLRVIVRIVAGACSGWRRRRRCAVVMLVGDRAGGGLPEPARDRRPDRLPAEAADAHLLGRRRAARRVRRRAAQLHADRADPEGDAGRGAGGRGRALLRARRRRLQGRAARRRWPTCGDARSQGASTITMQVARNFYLSTEKTFTRKIYEMLLTLKIESLLSKDQILELYMNQIFLGQRAYGFAVGQRDLLRQAAEGHHASPRRRCWPACRRRRRPTTRSSTRSAPRVRQRYILDRMLDNGFITRRAARRGAQAGAALPRADARSPVHAEYVAETARQLIFAQYGDEAYTRGLNVYLTINSAEQTVAYRALRKGIMDYEQRQVYRGPEAYVDLPADPQRARRAHRRGAGRPSRQRRAARRRGRSRPSPKKVVAVLQSGEADHRHRRRPEAGDLGLCAEGQPEDADPPRRGRAR